MQVNSPVQMSPSFGATRKFGAQRIQFGDWQRPDDWKNTPDPRENAGKKAKGFLSRMNPTVRGMGFSLGGSVAGSLLLDLIVPGSSFIVSLIGAVGGAVGGSYANRKLHERGI